MYIDISDVEHQIIQSKKNIKTTCVIYAKLNLSIEYIQKNTNQLEIINIQRYFSCFCSLDDEFIDVSDVNITPYVDSAFVSKITDDRFYYFAHNVLTISRY